MRMHPPALLRRLAAILIGMGSVIGYAHALNQDQPFLQETWNVAPGTVLEILAFPSTTDRQYSWSLTRADGTFVQADRGPLFRERFVESGDFQLRAEITDVLHAPVAARNFTVHVATLSATGSGSANESSFVRTDPPAGPLGVIPIDPQSQTILFSPLPGSANLTADLDAAVDTNGDGDPANDDDSRGTFFASDGSPLRIWYYDGKSDRTIAIRGSTAAGAQLAVLRVSADGGAPAESPKQPVQEPVAGLDSVIITDTGSGSFRFAVDERVLSPADRSLLFLWDFGDGHQSMLDRPAHTFAGNGQYAVSLKARDLRTGTEVLNVTGLLSVQTVVPPFIPPAGGSGASSATSSEPAEPGALSRWIAAINFRLVGIIVLILVPVIIAGITLMTVISKMAQRATLSGSKSSKPSASSATRPAELPSLDQQAPPMEVIDIAPTRHEEPMPPPPSGETGPSEPELVLREEQAPAWLKAGLSHATPPPEPRQESAAPSPPLPPQTGERRPLPPWLQEQQTPTPPPPPPPPPPQPAPAAEPPAEPPSQIPGPADEMELPTAPVAPGSPAMAAASVSEPQPKEPSVSVPPPILEREQEAETHEGGTESEKENGEQRREEGEAEKEPPKELTEAERERRRRKRARYRANKKAREEAVAQQDAPAVNTTQTEKDSPVSAPPVPAVPMNPAPAAPAEKPIAPSPHQKKESKKVLSLTDLGTAETKEEEADAPIAIIRAENLGQEKNDEKAS